MAFEDYLALKNLLGPLFYDYVPDEQLFGEIDILPTDDWNNPTVIEMPLENDFDIEQPVNICYAPS